MSFALKAFPSPFLIIILISLVKLQEWRTENYTKHYSRYYGKETPLYIEITCNRDAGITTWEGMYNLLEEDHPKVTEDTATAGS